MAAAAAATSGKIPLMTKEAVDPTWSSWHSNAEVKEAEEAAAMVVEPARPATR
jgi:hypothetical protein